MKFQKKKKKKKKSRSFCTRKYIETHKLTYSCILSFKVPFCMWYLTSLPPQKSFFFQSLPPTFCKLNQKSLIFQKSKNGSKQMMHSVPPPYHRNIWYHHPILTIFGITTLSSQYSISPPYHRNIRYHHTVIAIFDITTLSSQYSVPLPYHRNIQYHHSIIAVFGITTLSSQYSVPPRYHRNIRLQNSLILRIMIL